MITLEGGLVEMLRLAVDKVKMKFGSECYFHMGIIEGRPICVKVQWEPGHTLNCLDAKGEWALTVGMFEENSALFMSDWKQLDYSSLVAGFTLEDIAEWLFRTYVREERKAHEIV